MSQRRVPSPPVLAIASLLVAAGVYLTWLAGRLWFMADDWAFLLHRRVTLSGDGSLLQPHNDHWVTLPILVFRLLFHVVGMHHYLPYALVTIGLHLTVATLLSLLLWRAGAHPWVVVLVTVVIAFFGPGGLDILWDFQMVFVAPAALALGCLVLLDRKEHVPRFPVAVWLLLAATLMCSGAGVTMVAWVAAYTWLRWGLRPAVVVALPPTLVYVAWYLAYGRGTSPAPSAPPGRIVPFIVRGLASLWESVLPVPWLGVVVLSVITVVTVLARSNRRLWAFAAAGLLALLFNYVLLALTRAGLGVDTATSVRYLYVGVLLTLPAVGLTLDLVWRRMAAFAMPRTFVWLALGVVLVGSGVVLLHRAANQNEYWQQGQRGRVVAAAELVGSGAPLLNDRAEPEAAADIDVASLARPDVRSRLPDLHPSPQDVLGAAGFLQVDVSVAPLYLPLADGLAVRRTRALSTELDAASCQRLVAGDGATVELPPTSGSEFRLTVSGDEVSTQLVRDGKSGPRWKHRVEPGVELHVGSAAASATLRVAVPPGDVLLCSGSVATAGR